MKARADLFSAKVKTLQALGCVRFFVVTLFLFLFACFSFSLLFLSSALPQELRLGLVCHAWEAWCRLGAAAPKRRGRDWADETPGLRLKLEILKMLISESQGVREPLLRAEHLWC